MTTAGLSGEKNELTNSGENLAGATPPPKGVFFPRWVIAVIVGPIISGGFGACLYVTSSISQQKQMLDKQMIENKQRDNDTEKIQIEQSGTLARISDKIESNNTLMVQFIGALNKRVDRLENKFLFKNNFGIDRESGQDNGAP